MTFDINEEIKNETFKFSSDELDKLRKVKRLFVFPMILWFIIILQDVTFYIFRTEHLSEVKNIVEEFAFYSFPLSLLYIAFVSFYSSYRILESKNFKNVVIFLFFPTLAFFINDVVDINMPIPDKSTSILLIVIICFAIFGIIFFILRFIKLPEETELENKDEDTAIGKTIRDVLSGDISHNEESANDFGGNNNPLRNSEDVNARLGMVVSAIFSLLVASMIYFRMREGISFVIWGVVFGTFLSAMFLSFDKVVIGVFYFLNPAGAIYLYKLKKRKEQFDLQKLEIERVRQDGDLMKKMMKTDLIRKVQKIDMKATEIKYNEITTHMDSLIEKISRNDVPAKEKMRILDEVMQINKQLKDSDEEIKLQLPEPDYKDISYGERMSILTGFDDNEIKELIIEDLIEEKQKYFWKEINQRKVRSAVNDFDNEKYTGKHPILIAKTWEYYFEKNPQILKALARKILGKDKVEITHIKGTKQPKLFELRFSTQTRKYCAVVAVGLEDESYLIFGIFENEK